MKFQKAYPQDSVNGYAERKAFKEGYEHKKPAYSRDAKYFNNPYYRALNDELFKPTIINENDVPIDTKEVENTVDDAEKLAREAEAKKEALDKRAEKYKDNPYFGRPLDKDYERDSFKPFHSSEKPRLKTV